MSEATDPIGYVYEIRERASNLVYVGIHSTAHFDTEYFGSPMSKSGLRAIYMELWPYANRVGYRVPSYEEFSVYFEISVLEWCYSRDLLHSRESYWIERLDSYENGLNRNKGAGASSAFGPSYVAYCDVCKEDTKWKSNVCYRCLHLAIRSRSYCGVCDKETAHTGTSCLPCGLLAITALLLCDDCGIETKHRSGVCQRCVVHRTLNESECPIHGLTTFSGKSCRKCITGKGELKFCLECDKETTHLFGDCKPCIYRRTDSIKECPKHGLVMHRGNSCFTCVSQKSQFRRFCDACNQERPHRGDKCMTCSSRSSLETLGCIFCAKDVTHQKGVCLSCKPRHRKHTESPSSSCSLCAYQ